ncbi:hypothetical protein VTK73DRAFT_3495 [Phialemonium thermophilum]|uniref:Uncharacterized protein n=1 Tax=Phialemonium thermophilum TaxID=223376 RepID=A0ABR3WZE4_9PEZI
MIADRGQSLCALLETKRSSGDTRHAMQICIVLTTDLYTLPWRCPYGANRKDRVVKMCMAGGLRRLWFAARCCNIAPVEPTSARQGCARVQKVAAKGRHHICGSGRALTSTATVTNFWTNPCTNLLGRVFLDKPRKRSRAGRVLFPSIRQKYRSQMEGFAVTQHILSQFRSTNLPSKGTVRAVRRWDSSNQLSHDNRSARLEEEETNRSPRRNAVCL